MKLGTKCILERNLPLARGVDTGLVGAALLVPLVMLAFRKTRRFAQMMFLGVVATAVVIVVTGALTFWVMTKVSG